MLSDSSQALCAIGFLWEAARVTEQQFIENAKRRVKLETIRRCCNGLGGIWLAELFLEVERRLRDK